MSRACRVAGALVLVVGLMTGMIRADAADADIAVIVRIDVSDQTMHVYEDNREVGVWPVSTARSGYCTPIGRYQPIRLHRMWHSRKYDWAPMPFSIFFHGGYAIHGTTDIGNLGRPASHGCIRLHPDNAETLFDMVVAHGKDATLIVIVP